MEIRTFFKLKINIDDLDDTMPSKQKCAKVYKTELLIDGKDNNEIQLKIYFDDKEYLGEKIMQWNPNMDSNLLDNFKVIEIISPENLLEIDFSNYRCKGMEKPTAFYESNLKYFIIRLTGIRKTYKNSENAPSEVYLNQQAFGLIEMNYRYNSNFPWSKEEYNWTPINQIKEYVQFGKISFKPEYHFFNSTKNNLENISIHKEPRLTIEFNDLNVSEIKNHIELICTLYSLYSLENIDYSFSRIYTKDNLHVEIRDVSNTSVKDFHGLFRWDLYQGPLTLFKYVDSNHLLKNLFFYKKIVDRFIYAQKTSGESKFMILYNILEQVRNQYILDGMIETKKAGETPNLRKVIEEYRFNLSKTKTDIFIKEALEKIIEIVSEEDKELFKNEIMYKLTPIKVVSMKNQFQSLFDYIKIDPKDFDLNFLELKILRDSIFHGRPIIKDLEKLNKINKSKCLPKFVGTVILNYSGINDLKKNNRIDKK